MRERRGLGPLELVVITMIAVVVGLLCRNAKHNEQECGGPIPCPQPTSVCATYDHIKYCRQPAPSETP